jgi:hypothetical protein
MPRRQPQIAADKVVCNQLFADTVTSSPATESLASTTVTTTLAQKDSGKTIFLAVGDVDVALPAAADISAGWNVKFIATAVWTGDVDTDSAAVIIFGDAPGGGVTTPASGEKKIKGTNVLPGDWFSLLFDGTNFNVTGLGSTATYLVFT